MRATEFMLGILKKLQEDKELAESTSIKYIKNLYALNNSQSFKNLAWTKKKDSIETILKPYAKSTQKTLIASLVSVLSMYKSKPSYARIYKYWYAKMMDTATNSKEESKKLTNEKQKKNWIDWKDVLKRKEELKDLVEGFCKNKLISKKQYDTLLQYVILSLYTDIPPRRNKDYSEMWIIRKMNKKKDNSKNYLDLHNHSLIFNTYKTSKKYGKQEINFEKNDDLTYALNCYLKHHPTKKRMGKNTEIRLLVNSDGSSLPNDNSITRILNKALKKKVGSSMLRHIYLTSKYGDEFKKMEKDAENMGHSIAQQKEYVVD